jgi:hypothetical protein
MDKWEQTELAPQCGQCGPYVYVKTLYLRRFIWDALSATLYLRRLSGTSVDFARSHSTIV